MATTAAVIQVPTFSELYESLPVQYRTEKVRAQLQQAYDHEVRFIGETATQLAQQGKPYATRMFTFSHTGGSQWIADFSVKDLSRPLKDQYNWHLQNTSQLVYAGCILFDRNSFEHNPDHCISRHH